MRFWLPLAAVLLPLTAAAQSAQPTTLASLRDHARPLLIFTARPDDPLLAEQLRLLVGQAAGVEDRELVPIALPLHGVAPTPEHLSSAEAERLRHQLHIEADRFTVVLIGKDGGEKVRATQPIRPGELFATIDAMPMRQDEMRQRAH
jgi:hypothetical protein